MGVADIGMSLFKAFRKKRALKRHGGEMPSANNQPTEKLVIHNAGPEPLEVMVEMTPDRYVLQSGDDMEIEASLNGAPFHITPYSGGLQIYPGDAFDYVARINGVKVEPDWG